MAGVCVEQMVSADATQRVGRGLADAHADDNTAVGVVPDVEFVLVPVMQNGRLS